MNKPPRGIVYSVGLLAAFALLAGCRGNLGSAVAVATGRAEVQSLQTLAAERAAMAAKPGASSINQASYSPGFPGAAGGANPFAAVDPTTGNPTTPPTRDEAFAAVLPELQRLAETNPAAQQRLLEQMKTAEPAHWPLLVQRAKADLAVHTQLNEPRRDQERGAAADRHGHENGSSMRSRPAADPPSTDWPADARSSRPDDFPVQQASHKAAIDDRTAFAPPPLNRAGGPRADRRAERAFATRPSGVKPMAKLVSAEADRPGRNAVRPAVIENPMATAPPAEQLAWRDALRHAINDLDDSAPKKPRSAGESYQHARLRLLQLAAGDLDGAATAIPGLSSTEQSYWSHQLFALSKLMDDETHPDTKRRASAASLHLATAAAELAQLSSLSVHALTFCDEVYGFGVYDAIEEPLFQPGAALTIYAEVRHYKSTRVGSGLHATTLATSYRLVNSRGDVIDTGDFPLVEDECYSKRHDFYIQFTYPLPAEVKPGEYRLELTIEDRLGDKRGGGSIDLWVE